jgi:hypothetical protein
VRVVGKRSEIEMRPKNRLLHNGLIDDHQLETPPGVIPMGSSMMVRSCRPYPFLPKGPDVEEQLKRRLEECESAPELTILIRAARRLSLWREAARAHTRLVQLRKLLPKGPAPSSAPSSCEVAVVNKHWDGSTSGFGGDCVTVEPGMLCEVWRRDPSGWVMIVTSNGDRGWCSPHVIG